MIESRRTVRSNSRSKSNYKLIIISIFLLFKQIVQKTRLRDKDIQLCCMLIGTSFAFLLLCLPAEINDIFNYIGYERSCFHWFRKVILMLMQQLYYAGHFYIYILTGQIFRKHLYAIIFKRHRPSYMNKSMRASEIIEQRPSISTDINRMRTSFIEDRSRKFLLDTKHLTHV